MEDDTRKKLTDTYYQYAVMRISQWLQDQRSGQIIISYEYGNITSIKLNEYVGNSSILTKESGESRV